MSRVSSCLEVDPIPADRERHRRQREMETEQAVLSPIVVIRTLPPQDGAGATSSMFEDAPAPVRGTTTTTTRGGRTPRSSRRPTTL